MHGPAFPVMPRKVPPAALHVLQVILIHLSNLTGLADDYNKRTMSLLVSDIGTIVMGVTAAIASGYVKVTWVVVSCSLRAADATYSCISRCRVSFGTGF